jgi:hypothetical protein
MKKYAIAFLSIPLLYSFTSWAQEVAAPIVSQGIEQVAQVANPLLQSMNGSSGVTSMAVVALIVQALMLFINSKYGSLAGKYRFTIMSALTALGGIAALKLQGVDTFTAMTHSTTMATYQVFMNQAYKQFFKKQA